VRFLGSNFREWKSGG